MGRDFALRSHARPEEPKGDLEKSMVLACDRDQLASLNFRYCL